MKRSAGAHGMVMGVGLLMAACGPASESEIEVEIDEPGLEATGLKPGIPDTNGTPKLAWHTWKYAMVTALRSPLLKGDKIHPDILATKILDAAAPGGVDGKEVFGHTVRCAAAKGTVVHHGEEVYLGRGMVSSASAWTEQGLSDAVIGNVLECVIAYVNDVADGISVLLTGTQVADDGKGHAEYVHREALWCAAPSTGAVPTVSVYATLPFIANCSIDPESALRQRYCYKVGACDLNYMGSLADRVADGTCQNVGPAGHGQFTCNGKPCTMTWLQDIEPDWCREPTRPRPLDPVLFPQ
ncbi:hypothetical protein WMF45_18270 [Sorangium sp. So ce448]|uniref:hypothetical protein n=1 Tax=Sorangium sp. So ce448 TaxID=3133314 RepID=UPI003F61BD8C